MYAPTWRGENGNYKDVTEDYKKQLQLISAGLPSNYQLIIKPHVNAVKFIKEASVEIVPEYTEINEVLSETDLLISDYSSIVFDYYFTGKPTINWMYDSKDYAENAGFYPEVLSKIVWATNDADKLLWMLQNLEKYPAPIQDVIETDTTALNRLTNIFLEEEIPDSIKFETVDLYIVYASDVQKDSEKILRKIESLKPISNNVALLHVGKYSKSDNAFFDKLPKEVRNFYRVGYPDITTAEYISAQKLSGGFPLGKDDHLHLNEFIKREIQREMGSIDFNSIQSLLGIKVNDWISECMVSIFNKVDNLEFRS